MLVYISNKQVFRICCKRALLSNVASLNKPPSKKEESQNAQQSLKERNIHYILAFKTQKCLRHGIASNA